jgi:N-acyl homoserine lactone hydrolase
MTYAIHRLNLASVALAGQFNPPSYRDIRIAVFAYLLTSEEQDPVLIDTGVGEGVSVVEERFQPQRTSLIDQLAVIGVEPAEVKTIVNSHLHFDHCGNNRLFPSAEIEVARSLAHRYTVTDWFDYPGARIHAVDSDALLQPGVRLIASPGHTPGHQSVQVDTDQGPVMIAAQAAFSGSEYLRGGDPAEQAHEGLGDTYLSTIARLQELEAVNVCFSHDPATLVIDGAFDQVMDPARH